ncbi:uncharacterized protein LOC117170142 [Belonocnema kinseyi]|uniref:uncharacterized protein LOC117170142 n=1 Tax=Belonocnema kinseyi TaxID=2817044 RepID=UPI00143D5D57|nr:uncharacterized protein LOC117170142 [Belonocnema kinseyi]
MKLSLCAILGIVLVYDYASAEEEKGFLECILEANSASCARKRIAKEIDQIELEVTGKRGEVPMSVVLQESGKFIAEGLNTLFGVEETENAQNDESEDRGMGEARKKKFSKKKKKHLMKLIPLALLIKSKLSFLLQLISTHLQIKFFFIAVVSLIINIARFWLDLKKSHHPSKVIYYEHAQHQHHYDHEDEHGYWGRSIEESPAESAQKLAYKAHDPE